MLNLDGVLPIEKVRDLNEYTNIRFANKSKFQTPEALALYEQRYMEPEKIKLLCERVYGFELFEPRLTYIPPKIVKQFRETACVPVMYQPMKKVITVVYLPDIQHIEMEIPYHEVRYFPTTIYYYMKMYQQCYGIHRELKQIPVKMLFDFTISEAIEIGAADITFTTVDESTEVYFNARKKKIQSQYIYSKEIMDDLLKLLTIKAPMDRASKAPQALDVDINEDYRGRVEINPKFGGYMVTIRLLPNFAFNTDIRDLGLTPETRDKLIEYILDAEKGLRLFVGETMSGKNTTSLALLRELVNSGKYKVVSVEIPVEQKLPGVEQIDCDTLEEYRLNIRSLIRVNPDFIYITEIQDATGTDTVQLTNTAKCVLSTLHANSVGDTISRLVDITGMSTDRIIQALHTVVYQELVRDDENDRVYPRSRYVRFSESLKYQLYGKSLGEILKIIRDHEEGDVWNSINRMRL